MYICVLADTGNVTGRWPLKIIIINTIKHTSVLATIAKRTRAAPSPFSPLAPHRATATAKNSSKIAPEMGKKSKIAGKVDNGLKERLRANMKAKMLEGQQARKPQGAEANRSSG